MNPQVLAIGPWQLALALVFIAAAGGVSLAHGLGLGRDLALGTVRSVIQLILMGYVLTYVFAWEAFLPVALIFLVMVASAARIIRGRVKERQVDFLLPTFFSMLVSYGLVSVLVVGIIVGAKPWWQPQYFIPLAGMVVGNSMNALAISLERLFADLRARRDEVEMRLAHGADYREASQEITVAAIKAGMIPSINSLMGVGVVFIPGMMTGQILAGADPLMAVRYQIVVMLMLVGSTGLGSLIVVYLARSRAFSQAQQLILKPGNAQGTGQRAP